MDKEKRYVGCLVGGAIGDAMGYPIEFMKEYQIKAKYGLVKSFVGKPLISDDTQMTLYTATGLLTGLTRTTVRGVGDITDSMYVYYSYRNWYELQEGLPVKYGYSFLKNIPEANKNRAPGNTCLSALGTAYENPELCGRVNKPLNTSKGCGGVMRVAPVGLFFSRFVEATPELVAQCGANVGAITHGHSMSHMSSAYLSCLVYFLARGKELDESVEQTNSVISELFKSDKHVKEFEKIMQKAIELAKNNENDLDSIHQLGEGWIAEEALAIALYCALKHRDSFVDAIAASINHNGDSDSTGAICGNILGAYLGIDEILNQFPEGKNVELYELITEIASDLSKECPDNGYDKSDRYWDSKYLEFTCALNDIKQYKNKR